MKKHIIILLLTSVTCTVANIAENPTQIPQGISWQECIETHKTSMDILSYQLITSQYNGYIQGTAPKIADMVIKTIPIIESHEQLVDINTTNNIRITMLPQPNYPFASPDCNSGLKAASKVRKTVFNKLEKMVECLDLLAPQFGYAPGQLDIKIFEGLRDLATQETLFNNKAQEIRNANPSMNNDEVINETSKWVSPIHNNIPVHSTGGAVDIRLWDNHAKQFVNMGPFGVIWGKNTTAPTFALDLTNIQKNNRLYALIAATWAGLINYPYEYWHFSSGDRYASFWQEPITTHRTALYEAISQLLSTKVESL